MRAQPIRFIIIIFTLILLGCSDNHNDVKSIVITIDPNKKEDKYRVINISDKDSVKVFMEKFNNRESEPAKFYPRFSIEINYKNKTEKYLGNANHIKDAEGHTYKLLAKDWEIFNQREKIKEIKLKTSNGAAINLKFIVDSDDNSAPFYYKVNLFLNDKVLKIDEANNEYQFDKNDIKLFEYKNTIYIFCLYKDRPDPDKWRIFSIKNSKYSKAINLDADQGIDFNDADNDGIVEFGGFPQFYEAYCDKCDSAYYMSNLIYQIRDSITLDSTMTINENTKKYGKHIDFTRGKHIVKIK